MKTADVALVVAIVSAVLAAIGAMWQFLLYRLSGPRLLVRLTPAILSSLGTIVRGPDRGFIMDDMPPGIGDSLDGWSVDLAEVRLTNIGRTPVSVAEIELDFGRTSPSWRWWRRGRHRVRGFPIPTHGGVTDEVVRLETGQSAHVFFEIVPLIRGVRRRKPGKVVLRASACAAGRRPTRSAWRKRWVLHADRDSIRSEEQSSPELRAYQALWRSLARTPEGLEQVSLAWGMVVLDLSKGGSMTVEDLASRFEPILGPGQQMRAYQVLEAFLGEAPQSITSTQPEEET
jgi:hypothetical protein